MLYPWHNAPKVKNYLKKNISLAKISICKTEIIHLHQLLIKQNQIESEYFFLSDLFA